jgi:hypothetical protein
VVQVSFKVRGIGEPYKFVVQMIFKFARGTGELFRGLKRPFSVAVTGSREGLRAVGGRKFIEWVFEQNTTRCVSAVVGQLP